MKPTDEIKKGMFEMTKKAVKERNHAVSSGVSIRFLKQYLLKLEEKKSFWHHAVIHARWIDNGKGGSYDCPIELKKVEAKIEAIGYVLKNGC